MNKIRYYIDKFLIVIIEKEIESWNKEIFSEEAKSSSLYTLHIHYKLNALYEKRAKIYNRLSKINPKYK